MHDGSEMSNCRSQDPKTARGAATRVAQGYPRSSLSPYRLKKVGFAFLCGMIHHFRPLSTEHEHDGGVGTFPKATARDATL